MRGCGGGLGPARWRGFQRGSPSVEVGPWWGYRGGAGVLHGRKEALRAEDSAGSPTGSLVPKWTGKALTASFRSSAAHPQCVSQGVPCPHWTPNHGWVSLGLVTPPLPLPPLRGAGPVGPVFTVAPPSLPPTLSGSAWLRGPRWVEDQARDLSRLPGTQVGRGTLEMLPFDPLPSQ